MVTDLPAVARTLGLPLFPWLLFPVPLPVRLYIRFGAPMMLPATAADAGDQHRVDQLNELVRRKVQRLITDTLRRRTGVIFSDYRGGRKPRTV